MRFLKYCGVLLLLGTMARGADERLSIGGGEFPLSIGGAPWAQINNYAGEGGAGGIGIGYRSAAFKADVYLYDAGDQASVGKSLDERFLSEAGNFPATLKELERRGFYSAVKIEGASEEHSSSLQFTHLWATFTEKGEKKKTHFYLTEYRGRLLKIRITVPEAASDFAIKKGFLEAAAFFQKDP